MPTYLRFSQSIEAWAFKPNAVLAEIHLDKLAQDLVVGGAIIACGIGLALLNPDIRDKIWRGYIQATGRYPYHVMNDLLGSDPLKQKRVANFLRSQGREASYVDELTNTLEELQSSESYFMLKVTRLATALAQFKEHSFLVTKLSGCVERLMANGPSTKYTNVQKLDMLASLLATIDSDAARDVLQKLARFRAGEMKTVDSSDTDPFRTNIIFTEFPLSKQLRTRVITALAKHPEKYADTLRAATQDECTEIRKIASLALGDLKNGTPT